jgi:xylulokinase
LSGYFAKYGLRPGIPVTVWSGDNPCSLIGSGGHAPGSAVISLGTSDTFFGSMKDISAGSSAHGHIFGNPAGGFMKLLCFANGSLTREAVRSEYGFSRDDFENAIKNSEPGKYQMLPFLFPESTPPAPGGIIGNFDKEKITPAEFIRALTESQMLTMRYHAALSAPPGCIRLTGGASASVQLRQLAANIFQAPVEIGNISEAPALGAAMRAANSAGNYSFAELTEKFCTVTQRIEPERGSAGASDRALENFAGLMKEFTAAV